MNANNLASLMMVTYNRLNLTKQTIDSLIVTIDFPFELIIIDNASTDETLLFLDDELKKLLSKNEYFTNLIIKKNQTNKGIAYGRNQALALSSGDWLVTLDNDIMLPVGWLSEAIDIITKNPGFGMIGVNMENVPYPLVILNDKEFQKKARGNLGTACIVFPRSFHRMLGFFNTEMGLYAHEDADMGMRARVAGFQLGYVKEMGTHLGEGIHDVGEYRSFKTESHRSNLAKFNENCRAYANHKKPLYIPFKT